MKKENLVILAGFVLIVLVGVFTFARPGLEKEAGEEYSSSAPVAAAARISAGDLLKALKGNEDVLMLDLRNEQDFNLEHIVDSINIPYAEIPQSTLSVKNRKIVIVAAEAGAADRAADFFEKKGAAEAKVLEGGFSGWKNAGGLIINWGDPTSFVNQSKVTFIEQEEVQKMIEERIDIEIMDVRANEDFVEFLPSARNIPLDQLEKRRSESPIGKEIVVYGNTELEGFMAAVRLYDMNFFSAYVLREGFQEWKEKSYPVTR